MNGKQIYANAARAVCESVNSYQCLLFTEGGPKLNAQVSTPSPKMKIINLNIPIAFRL